MNAKSTFCSGSVAKLGAGAAVIALVTLGLLGLVLPILPGILFLVIAAAVASKHFPAFGSRLRRHRAARSHLDFVERARGLDASSKIRLAGWYCVKLAADGVAALAAALKGLRARRH